MNQREKAIQDIRNRIANFERAIDLVKKIPFHVPLHIVHENCRVGESNGPTVAQDNEMIVIVTSPTDTHLLVNVLAAEKPWWDGTDYSTSIAYSNVKSWRLFDKRDAGLYVNWDRLTNEFKRLAFGK